jgi:hypothetical protein
VAAFTPTIPGAPEVEVRPDIVRGPKVFVEGAEVRPVRERGRPSYPIRLADGSDESLTLHGAFLGLRARIAGREYPIEPRLTFIELFLVVLPLALLTIRPPVGALVGAVGVMVSLLVMKQPWPSVARAAVALAVFAAGVVLLLAT